MLVADAGREEIGESKMEKLRGAVFEVRDRAAGGSLQTAAAVSRVADGGCSKTMEGSVPNDGCHILSIQHNTGCRSSWLVLVPDVEGTPK
jgi:hypothetical protein